MAMSSFLCTGGGSKKFDDCFLKSVFVGLQFNYHGQEKLFVKHVGCSSE